MKRYLSILIISIVAIDLFSQERLVQDSTDLIYFDFQKLTGERYYDPGEKFIDIYFTNNWCPGRITIDSSLNINNLILKFNTATHHLILQDDKLGLVKIDNDNISSFCLVENSKFNWFDKMNIDTLNLKSDLFYQVIYKNKIMIYAYRYSKFNSTITKNDGLYYKYVKKSIYVLYIGKNIFLFNKPTQKAFYEQFPKFKTLIKQTSKQYIKKFKTEGEFFDFLIENESILIQ